MSVSESRFTVAKLDAGMAILLTSDHHLIEFPSLLLPTGVTAGSIIDLNVSQNTSKEREEFNAFKALQEDIRGLFATHVPSTPELSVRNITQTSVVLEWNLLDLATADMVSLSLYKNGSQLGKIPNATTTTTKLSGLALDTEYSFQLILRTTAGVFKSNTLKIKTHKMTNLHGLNVCISNVRPEEKDRVAEILSRIGAKAPHDKVRIDTTHFVTNRGMGDEFKKAQTMNIPIVVPEFVEACEAEGRLMRAGSYYLDSDPALRSKRVTATSMSANAPSTVQHLSEADTASVPSLSTVLPTQTTPIEEEKNKVDNESELQSRDHPGPSALATKQLITAVTDTVKDLTLKGKEGIENIATQVLKTGEAESGTDEKTSIQELPQRSTVTEAEGTEVKAIEELKRVEPHPEAARAVESLPVQFETEAMKQGGEQFPPSMGRDSAAEDMEDVAL